MIKADNKPPTDHGTMSKLGNVLTVEPKKPDVKGICSLVHSQFLT